MSKIVSRVVFALMLMVVALAGLVTKPAVTQAQGDAKKIEYGQSVKGEVTADQLTFTYTFTGAEKDVIVIEYGSDPGVDYDKALQYAEFKLTDDKKKLLLDTTTFSHFSTVDGVIQLPAAGTYTITLASGKNSDTKKPGLGKFVMKLYNAPSLDADKEIKDTVTDKTEKFYYVDSTDPFTVTYTKTDGDFTPAVTLNDIKDSGDTEEAASLSGKILTAGQLTVTPDSGVLYLVKVAPSFASFSTGHADYTIVRSAVKS